MFERFMARIRRFRVRAPRVLLPVRRGGEGEGTSSPARTPADQRREALRHANEIRAMRAQMKRELARRGKGEPG